MSARTLSVVVVALFSFACGESSNESSQMTSTPGSGTTTGTGTATGTGTGEEDVTSSSPPRADLGFDPPQSCGGYCEAVSECAGQSEDDCLIGCSATYDERASVEGACPDEHEALLSCVAALDCDGVAAHLADPGTGPCSGPHNAAELQCALGDGELPPTCVELCATVETCGFSTGEECEASCSQALVTAAEAGSSCAAAQQDLFACTAALTCEEYGDWMERTGSYPCQAPDEAAEAACTGE